MIYAVDFATHHSVETKRLVSDTSREENSCHVNELSFSSTTPVRSWSCRPWPLTTCTKVTRRVLELSPGWDGSPAVKSSSWRMTPRQRGGPITR